MPEFTSSDGVEIVYDDVGPRDGVPTVLCHGLAAAAEQLAADAEYFAGLGHRVLMPDIRGHGRSGRPEAMRAEDFSIARMGLDQVEMLDHAHAGTVHWVGNSLGGIVALHMLNDHAPRFRSLATFGTAYALNLPMWVGNLFPFVYGLFGPTFTGTLTGITTTRNKAARPLIERLIREFDPEVGKLASSHLCRYDLIANAVAVTLPILLLRGGRDTAVNAGLGPTLQAMQGRPNFTMVELPRGGHCANLDATDEWRSELLRFWAKSMGRG